ncbi:MAG: hypothetical protein EBZ58_03070 [Bacteroidetes bacterium]|jgi:hypothetical protein|nr:hypothetical protein [Bacteroidota bacterium]
MNNGKLYVKSTCMICLGKKNFCTYCDAGLTYTEAADTIIKEWLKQQSEEVRRFIVGDGDEKK